MNIYKHEFKMHLRSVVTWSISLAVLIFVFTSIFSGFAKDAALLNETLSQFPEELLMAFGMTNLDMSTILGFFALAFLFCQICLAIQAANYGFSLLSIEERELTADFLLSKPVGRKKILTSKLLAAITGLAITNAVVWISSFGFISVYQGPEGYDPRSLVILLLSIVIFQLFFLTVGMLISLIVKRVRSVTSFSMGLVFGLYILNAFSEMLGKTSLEIFSPFKQFDPNYIIKNATYDLPLVLLNISIIVISVVGSYVLYSKRDIPSAV